MIRTKVVATMGPAVAGVERVASLLEAGTAVCRLNFSHGGLDQHLEMLRTIREAALRQDRPIAVLGDLSGPKIRLGKVADADGSGGMPIAVGDTLVVQRDPIVGAAGRVSTTYPGFVDDVQVGQRVYVEDGLLRFVCTDKGAAELRCQCTAGGVLRSSKGVNLPNTAINLPSLTERDWQAVDWAIEHDLDYLALSFVRHSDDILLLRQHLRNKVSDIHLIAKIEKAEAIDDIEAIIEASDALMIARGDLGVEMDLARLPLIQKDVIRRCRHAGKPVIVATQMLQSMIEHPSPTRAEVSDVANAILDGADAVMLSGETSVGKFPEGAVHTMMHIAAATEEFHRDAPPDPQAGSSLRTMHLSASIARGVRLMVDDLRAPIVAVFSQTGATARIFSKHRYPVPIVALSSDHRALRRMALHYGVLPQEMPPPGDMAELVTQVDALLRSRGLAAAGQRVIIAAGASLGTPGTMNGIVIHTIGEPWIMSDAAGADAEAS